MVKRGKVPKTRISLCNKHCTVLYEDNQRFSEKKGGAFFVRQIVTFIIIRALCTVKSTGEQRIWGPFSETTLAVKVDITIGRAGSHSLVEGHHLLIVEQGKPSLSHL